MAKDPCLCCRVRNKIPTSKRGLCARCEEIVKVINYLAGLEKAEAERLARPRASGLVLPNEIRKGRAR